MSDPVLRRSQGGTDLDGILALQAENLAPNLTPEQRAREGFLTSRYDRAFLEALHAVAPAFLVEDAGRVVAYALVATRAARGLDASLDGLFATIDATGLDGEPLAMRRHLVCAAICVARAYRGRGLTDRLYGALRAAYAASHDCLVTDIARANARSLAAHRRTGFEVRASTRYDGQDWDLVVQDWRVPPTA